MPKNKEQLIKLPVCPLCKCEMMLVYIGLQPDRLVPAWLCHCPVRKSSFNI